MTVGFRRLAVVPFVVALAMLLAPSASADAYTDYLVSRFNAQTHVIADPEARPALQNPAELNRQILTSRWTWSSTPPVWVAAVSHSQTGMTTTDGIHTAFLGRNPQFSGVILVIDGNGYHVRGYNVPKAVADSVDPAMAVAAKDHRGDPYGAASEFVSKLASVNAAPSEPVATSPVADHRHTSWSGLWVTLAVFAAVLAMAGLFWFAVNRNRKRRKDTEAKEQVNQELIAAAAEVSDLDNAVLAGTEPDVSAEQLKANSSLYDARKAYEAGDYAAARAHLGVVQSTVAKANRKLNPATKPNVEAVTSVPDEDRKQATVRTTNPDTGQTVTINNNDYSTTQQPGYSNYYGGGYHNGVFFYPGFYPYPFWGMGWGWALTDVLLMDALLDDRWGGSYERGFEAGQDSAMADVGSGSGQSAGYDSQQGDVGFSGNDSGGGYDSSGGDVSFSGDSSSGGYDSGGGNFDFGGFGGSDSGGGNFDFGGGSDFGGGGFDSGGGGDFGF